MKRITTICVIIILALLDITAQDELTLLATIQGENEGDAFVNVDAVGDINGDGYNDFIVGGKGDYVKLYFGSENFDTSNYIRFNKGTWKRVFASGCGVGDLNGDGYNDFIINTMFDVWDYRVYVYFGGEEIDTTNYLVIRNTEYWYSGFGGSSISGDLNGDGYDDLVISAPNDDIDARGRVYIYFGGEEMNTECDVYLEGREPGDNFGNSVSIVGDVNGDGYGDLLVGAPQDLKGGAGKAYMFLGGNNIGFDNYIVFNGDSTLPYNSFGRVVSGLGDINNDGFNDFGILSISYIEIYSGETLQVLSRISEKEYSGISNGFDLNNDGCNDFLFGYEYLGDEYTLGVGLFLGNELVDTVLYKPLIEKKEYGFLGRSLSICGDIDNNGYPEILIGSGNWNSKGYVSIYTFSKLNSVNSENKTIPQTFQIDNNYPNPFNPSTKIRYTVYEACELNMVIHDITGKKVNRLFTGYQIPGTYEMTWEGVDNNNSKVASGVYLLRVSAQPTKDNSALQQKVIKLMLMR